MKAHPLIFTDAMVQALLDGRKTQTRRIVSPGTCTVLGFNVRADNPMWTGLRLNSPNVEVRNQSTIMRAIVGQEAPDDLHLNVPWIHPEDEARGLQWDGHCFYRVRPILSPGDLLWVRETWGNLDADHPSVQNGRRPRMGDRLVYRANPADDAQWRPGHPGCADFAWRPSIHMPRWASRLTLEITHVWIERLQDISEADAEAEGVLWVPGHGEITYDELRMDPGYSNYLCCRQGFEVLWDSLNAKRGYPWASNPWVCAISFKCIRQNIDDVVKARKMEAP